MVKFVVNDVKKFKSTLLKVSIFTLLLGIIVIVISHLISEILTVFTIEFPLKNVLSHLGTILMSTGILELTAYFFFTKYFVKDKHEKTIREMKGEIEFDEDDNEMSSFEEVSKSQDILLNYELGEGYIDRVNYNKKFKFANKINTDINNPDYILYSILYGTNRKYIIKEKKIDYQNSRDDKLHIGKCEVSIPLLHKMGVLERPSWFSNLFFKESPEKHFTLLETDKFDQIKFIKILSERIGNSEQKDILLFIHGFNVDFKEAMLRTAQLGFDLNFKGAVTAFSWPSDGSVSGYIADTDTAKISSNYLSDFIKTLLQPDDVKKLHIIAHSMGNVVLTNALMQLKKEGLFPNTVINQIILAAPDIDKDVFLNQIMPEINRSFGLTLYASNKDKALIASKKIRKGYARLGDGGDNIVIVDGLDSVDASKVDTSLLGHGYFSDTQSLLNDIHMTLLGLPPTNRVLDTKCKVIEGKEKLYWVFRNS